MDWPLRFNQLSTTPARLGWQFLYFVGVMVVINGVLAILIGITIQLLPMNLARWKPPSRN